MIYEALTHNNRNLATIEINSQDEVKAHEIARRKTWKKIAKTSPKMIEFFKREGFWICLRPGGTWGQADFYGK